MPKAYVFTANGGPEVESFADLPHPAPGPGQLLVGVHAAGVNPADWKRDRAPEALRLVEAGHARGKVVIEVAR